MNPVDLWVLGVFQGDTGADALPLTWLLGVEVFMLLGRLYEEAGGLIEKLPDEMTDIPL